VFLLREHFRSLGLGKDRYRPLIASVSAAAGILQPNGQAYAPDELKLLVAKELAAELRADRAEAGSV